MQKSDLNLRGGFYAPSFLLSIPSVAPAPPHPHGFPTAALLPMAAPLPDKKRDQGVI